MEFFVGCESEKNEVEERDVWRKGGGRGDGEWEAALKEELHVV